MTEYCISAYDSWSWLSTWLTPRTVKAHQIVGTFAEMSDMWDRKGPPLIWVASSNQQPGQKIKLKRKRHIHSATPQQQCVPTCLPSFFELVNLSLWWLMQSFSDFRLHISTYQHEFNISDSLRSFLDFGTRLGLLNSWIRHPPASLPYMCSSSGFLKPYFASQYNIYKFNKDDIINNAHTY